MDSRYAHRGAVTCVRNAVDVDGLSTHLGDVERSNVSYGNWMGREEGRGLGGSGVIQWGGEGSGENVGKGARIHGAL